ncbi:MAG TPA: V-type ATP synthase subunit F [Thermoanaerobaculia bacterium]|nr:V-type ATP synthase subunit F [Thermoanaerobaculia bacterium]
MTPFVIGTRPDVVGFALAGIDGTICATAAEADRALSELTPDHIAIVSPEFAECEQLERAAMYVVLPRR